VHEIVLFLKIKPLKRQAQQDGKKRGPQSSEVVTIIVRFLFVGSNQTRIIVIFCFKDVADHNPFTFGS
jgi:hypothetical protein